MPQKIRTEKLSDDDVTRLLEMKESCLMDKKGKNIMPAKLSKTVSAFANNMGGEIYLGISSSNDKQSYFWDGFLSQEEANQHIEIIDTVVGNFDDYDIVEYSNEQHETVIFHITIHKTSRVIYASDGIPYCRISAQNKPFNSPENLRRLELDKGITSYENELTQCKFDDIKESVALKTFISQVVPASTAYKWLRKQQVMSSDTKISVAGVLLYDDNPATTLPKRSSIRIVRYHTDENEGTRETLASGFPVSMEGDVYTLIKETVKKVVSIVESTDVVGTTKIEGKKYPEVALHEIITNAVLHRDYSILTDIQIRIFTNRIEVESPGRLPGHITIENILKEQLSRNGKIVNLISKFPNPPNKDVGEGLNTAFAAMLEMQLKKPLIRENEKSVLVIIKHERLADAETLVLEYLETNPSINNSTARSLTGISDANKMKRVFNRLKDRDILERVPGKNSSSSEWRLKKRGSQNNEQLSLF